MGSQVVATGEVEAATERPWHAAYPAPGSSSKTITAAEVLRLLQFEGKPEESFVLVDVRRVDHEGGTIQGSINLPAQSLYPTIPSIYRIFKAANVRRVIWYCGSSRGRGPRAAAWFNDYIQVQNDSEMESLVLVGGIKAWASAGDEYTCCIQEYDRSKWT